MRVAPEILLSPEESQQLEKFARGRSTPARLVQRAQIVLLASEGKENREIASELGIVRHTVGRWRSRYAQLGLAGIEKDSPRSGRLPTITEEVIQEVVRKTTQETPSGATHWSTRSMAKATGLSAATIRRIWRRHGLKPHRVRTFKLSNDPRFVEKLEEVIGLYLNPPEHALVLCVDEKSQIQALDRTQPGLPIKKGRCGTMTHDYKRNGTTTLFAALNTLDGKVIGSCMPRHRHQEWLKFLKQIVRETPAKKQIHLIADNYSTHKHATVLRWLDRHPRIHLHFTPTSASWLNMVERFFRDLTEKQISRGVFHSVSELETTILSAIEQHNIEPKPFIWTAKASDILEKVTRARRSLDKVASA
ncbi:MAG TPA: IS630 family transposase [Thermoanaerobaculia bacterium]|nr:IS630 family transposase [Thermoanaerobaculia bacterium]